MTLTSAGNDQITFFVDEHEVLNLIKGLCTYSDLPLEKDCNYVHERLTVLLTKYLEQPAILNNAMLPMISILCGTLLEIAEQFQRQITSQYDHDRLPKHNTASHDLHSSNDVQDQQRRMNHFHAICQCIQLLCRVRGFKHVVKYFPHEVLHLELCVMMLRLQDTSHFDTWPTRYVLLLWLSILNSIPFSIQSLDSNFLGNTKSSVTPMMKSTYQAMGVNSSVSIGTDDSSNSKLHLVDTILSLCTSYLSDSGLVREAGAYCIASMLSRPDIQHVYLAEYVSYCQDIAQQWIHIFNDKRDINDNQNDSIIKSESYVANSLTNTNPTTATFQIIGTLYSLCQVFKKGDRLKLIKIAKNVLTLLLNIPMTFVSSQTMIRKLLTKLYGKVALILLPPKEATWCYSRGRRSLNIVVNSEFQKQENKNKIIVPLTNDSTMTTPPPQQTQTIHENIEYIDEIEEIIDVLLNNLQDKDTIVRWSAAKNIGRIAMRLSPDYSKDIVDSVLLMFEDIDNDCSWNGGAYALAELARRNILPHDVVENKVIDIIKFAIKFDVLKGHNSIGSHVRDAGCYVCWSLGHSYDPVAMANYIHELGCHMLITAVFDREVNCRRAASAAFQENVGRQGAHSFPHGLDIMAIADYHSLGNRTYSYLNIAPRIAVFDTGLLIHFQYHLRYVKLVHWDIDIRTLASKSLAELVAVNREKSLELLPDLIKDCLLDNVFVRHGCLLGCAELIHALYIRCYVTSSSTTNDVNENYLQMQPSDAILSSLIDIVPKMLSLRLYRGKGAEILRVASCFLIEKISQCYIALPGKIQVKYMEMLIENSRQPHKTVQLAAQSALRQFLYTYFNSKITTFTVLPTDKLQNKTIQTYIRGLLDENVAVARGSALALGVLPSRFCTLNIPSEPERLQYIIQVIEKSANLAVTSSFNITNNSNYVTDLNGVHEQKNTSVQSPLLSVTSSANDTTAVTSASVIDIAATATTATSVTDSKIEEFKRKYLEKQEALKKEKEKSLLSMKKTITNTMTQPPAVNSANALNSQNMDMNNATGIVSNADMKSTTSSKQTKSIAQEDIETRLNLVNSLPEIIEKLENMDMFLGDTFATSFYDNLITVINMLLKLSDDYTVDNRGDVGSWVRRAALLGLERMFYLSFRKLGFNMFCYTSNTDVFESPTTSVVDNNLSVSDKYMLTSFGVGLVVKQYNSSNIDIDSPVTNDIKDESNETNTTSDSKPNELGISSVNGTVTGISNTNRQLVITEVLYPWMSGGYMQYVNNNTIADFKNVDNITNKEDELEIKCQINQTDMNNNNNNLEDENKETISLNEASTVSEDIGQLTTSFRSGYEVLFSHRKFNSINTSNLTSVATQATVSTNANTNDNDNNGSSSISLKNDQISLIQEKFCENLKPLLSSYISKLVRQLGEKLDVIRAVCGEILRRLCSVCNAITTHKLTETNTDSNQSIQRLQFLISPELNIFQSCMMELSKKCHHIIEWSLPEIVFPFLIDLYKNLYCYMFSQSRLQSTADLTNSYDAHKFGYILDILSGLIISVGCINEKISKTSKKCFIELFMFTPNDTHHTNMSDSTAIGTYTTISTIGKGDLIQQEMNQKHITKLFITLVTIMCDYPRIDRVIVPLLKALNTMLQTDVLTKILSISNSSQYTSNSKILQEVKVADDIVSDTSIKHTQQNICKDKVTEYLMILLRSVKSELSSTSDVIKIKLIADLYEKCLLYAFLRFQVMKSLVFMLGHRIAIVRKYVAEVLYVHLLSDSHMIVSATCIHHTLNTQLHSLPNVQSDHSSQSSSHSSNDFNISKSSSLCAFLMTSAEYDQLILLLTTTVWEESLSIGRDGRASVANLLHVQFDKITETNSTILNAKAAKKPVKVNDELLSYASLVRDAGY